MNTRAKSIIMSASVGLFGMVGPSLAQNYTFTPVPDPQSDSSIYIQGINSNGQFTGYFNTTTTATGSSENVADTITGQISGGTVTMQTIGYVGGNIPPTGPNDTNYPALDSWGLAINSSGTVAGAGQMSGLVESPFQPSNGLTALGTTGGVAYQSFATSINDSGIIVGVSSTSGNKGRAVVSVPVNGVYPSTPTALALSSSAEKSAGAYGINNAGTVVGYTSTSTGPYGGLTNKTAAEWTSSGSSWTQTAVTDPAAALGNSGGHSMAFAVDSQGDFAGVAEVAGGTEAFIELAGSGTVLPLGPSGGSSSISEPQGSWAGYSGSQGDFNAVNYPLGICGSLAESMYYNSSTGLIEVVGYAANGSGGVTDAQLWTVNPTTDAVIATPLQDLLPAGLAGDGETGWLLQEATGINSNGQIVGYGLNTGYQEAAFILSPQTASVPEPAIAGSIASLAGIALLVRRRRC
jgi:hypothetical protein